MFCCKDLSLIRHQSCLFIKLWRCLIKRKISIYITFGYCLAQNFYLNNRVFLSRNYRLIVAPRKFYVLKTNIFPRSEASRAKYASFKDIKFPRGNYQTDNSETETLHCLYCSPLNFLPRASSKVNLSIARITIDFKMDLINRFSLALSIFFSTNRICCMSYLGQS